MKVNKYPVFLAICMAYASAAYAENNLRFASSWVGKYPSEPIEEAKSGLLSQAAIRSSLKTILPRPEAEILSKLTIEVPVREIDGFIVVNKCRPHNCPADMATVVIDVNKTQLWVGFFSRENSRTSTRWYGTAEDYSHLPESIKKDFIVRHGD